MGESVFFFFKKNQLVFENIEAFYIEKNNFHGLDSGFVGKILPDCVKKGFCRKFKRKPIDTRADGWKRDGL